ncbi:hypothetical protein N7478_011681 [Penicillium angulare]|uniref:uncharacterized protein n=1 Tax=Penicillium angulare TaxID=116970 RepID=UPI00254122E6|nr:uncharacterized protein N7478_011681 [Penicillium angulare]KAJ5261086.1 hypothetical protein N7478_011681 [Penicillium angulare]
MVENARSTANDSHRGPGIQGVSITTDAQMGTHSLSISLTHQNDNGLLDCDFVPVVKADGLDNPHALLESHNIISGQQELMVTLVSKFELPLERREILFVFDRTDSMSNKMLTVKLALSVFLMSLSCGTYFNICSFGDHYSPCWKTAESTMTHRSPPDPRLAGRSCWKLML